MGIEELRTRLSAGAVGVLASRSTGERITGRPVEFIAVPFEGALWFICPAGVRLLAQIELVSEVQVVIADDRGWTVVGGKARRSTGLIGPPAVDLAVRRAQRSSVAVQVTVLTVRHWSDATAWAPDLEVSSAQIVP